MELHSLPVDGYIGGTFEGMHWMLRKGCPQPKAKQAIDKGSSDRSLCESIDRPEAFNISVGILRAFKKQGAPVICPTLIITGRGEITIGESSSRSAIGPARIPPALCADNTVASTINTAPVNIRYDGAPGTTTTRRPWRRPAPVR